MGSAIKHNRNMSFSNFVNMYRINHAKKLLEGKDGKLYTLAHIYSASGFQNQPTFNRVFKENTGVTPSEYLARLRM